MPMTPDELRDFVVANDSFGFEMKVGSLLRQSVARDVQHGATYSDPVTGLNRQFDFRFTIRSERRCLLFALECKNISSDFPVIVCGCKRPKREAFLELIISQIMGSGPTSQIRRVSSTSIYPETGFVGKSVLKPERDGSGKIKMRSNDGEIHDRWAQAIASSHDLIHVASKTGSAVCSAIVPCVVVPDGSLWQTEYDEKGSLSGGPKSVDECAFFVGHKYQIEPEERHQPVVLSHLHFVTLSGLDKLLKSLAPSQVDWDRWIPDEVLASYRP